MVFVTVGTHEQPFDRLVKEVDRLKAEDAIWEEVFIQTGYCTYEPEHCEWNRLISHHEMEEKIARADLVITHGGPASFLAPLQRGKIPIVVPRQKRYGEHVNDHQLEFCRAVAEKMGNIILIEEVGQLGEAVRTYRETAGRMRQNSQSNNDAFCKKLGRIAEGLLSGKREEKQL